jgi:hypothetical protein
MLAGSVRTLTTSEETVEINVTRSAREEADWPRNEKWMIEKGNEVIGFLCRHQGIRDVTSDLSESKSS